MTNSVKNPKNDKHNNINLIPRKNISNDKVLMKCKIMQKKDSLRKIFQQIFHKKNNNFLLIKHS